MNYMGTQNGRVSVIFQIAEWQDPWAVYRPERSRDLAELREWCPWATSERNLEDCLEDHPT